MKWILWLDFKWLRPKGLFTRCLFMHEKTCMLGFWVRWLVTVVHADLKTLSDHPPPPLIVASIVITITLLIWDNADSVEGTPPFLFLLDYSLSKLIDMQSPNHFNVPLRIPLSASLSYILFMVVFVTVCEANCAFRSLPLGPYVIVNLLPWLNTQSVVFISVSLLSTIFKWFFYQVLWLSPFDNWPIEAESESFVFCLIH